MMPAVAILAGGYAKRLYPVTKTIPKSMIEVVGRPFVAHQLELLKRNGFKNIVICSGHLSQQIEDFVGDGKTFGLSVRFSVDGKKLLGTAGAIRKALPLLTDIFLVMYGDSYLDINFQAVVDYFSFHDKKGLMTVLKNNNKWDQSNVVYENGNVVAYDKKTRDQKAEYIDYGLGLLRKTAFDESNQKEVFDLVELYKDLIRKEQMLGFEVKKRFYEIGSPAGLAETEKYLSGKINKRQGGL